MSLFLLLLYVCLYVIMAVIVWFDKRDSKGTRGRDANSAGSAAAAHSGDGGKQSSGTDYENKGFMEQLIDEFANGNWGE